MELHPGHIQLGKLRENALGQLLRSFLPVFPKHQSRIPGLLFRFFQLPLQALQMVIGKLDIIQLLFGFLQIFQNVPTGGAVLSAELVNHIQPGLDLLQLIRAVAQLIPGIPNLLGDILHLIFQVIDPIVEGGKAVAEANQPGQGIFRLRQQTCRAIGVLAAIQTLCRIVQTVGELLGILQNLPAFFQSLILSRLQLCFFNLCDLIAKGFHPAELLSLVHSHPFDLPAEGCDRGIFLLIIGLKLLIVPEGIQHGQVIVLIKQGGGIMLAVNIDQLNTQLPQNGNRNQTAVDAADILSIQINLTLNHSFGIIFHAVFFKPLKLRNTGKNRPNRCRLGSGADHIPVGPFPQNGGNRINHNGFTCAGLTGKDIEAPVEGNFRTFNDRNVFNMQKTQHSFSPFYFIRFLISPQKAAAALVSRITTTTVSSPARVPRTTLIFIASSAEAAALANPGMV